ncbi:MAG TPA: hypothetical protein VER08_12340 [Pyrinomonadaceae bacterium]|nr:hypothetical protein [Pyrinomonadaceae bacterium]
MDFDEYWPSLVNRVYGEREELRGDEERFYRLSCIYGETMVDGIEAYFERRFDEFETDMDALRAAGFGELASEFQRARELLFGSAPLEREAVEAVTTRLLDEMAETEPVLAEIGRIYDRVIPEMERLEDYKYAFGLAAGLFRDA